METTQDISGELSKLNTTEASNYVLDLVKNGGLDQELVMAKYSEYLFDKNPSQLEVLGCRLKLASQLVAEFEEHTKKLTVVLPEIKDSLPEKPQVEDIIDLTFKFLKLHGRQLGETRLGEVGLVLEGFVDAKTPYETTYKTLDTYSLAKFGLKSSSLDLAKAIGEQFGK